MRDDVDPNEMFRVLREWRGTFPTERFGQMFGNIAAFSPCEAGGELTREIEDDILLAAARHGLSLDSLPAESPPPNADERLFELIERLWRQHPSLRLGQLVDLISRKAGRGVANVEDEDFVLAAELCLQLPREMMHPHLLDAPRQRHS